MKLFRTIFDFLDTIYLFGRLIGLFSISRHKNANDQYIYYPVNTSLIPNICVNLLVLSMSIINLLTTSPIRRLNGVMSLIYMSNYFSISAGSSICSFICRTHSFKFLESFEKLDKVDKYLSELQMPISYTGTQIGIYFGFFLLVFQIFCPVIFIKIFNKPIMTQLTETGASFFSFCILFFAIVVWTIFRLKVTFRLRFINLYIRNLRKENHSEKCVYKKIVLITEIHCLLCQIMNGVTKLYAPIFVVIYLLYIIFLTTSLLILNFEMVEYETEAFLWLAVFMTFILMVTIQIEFISKEAKNSAREIIFFNKFHNNLAIKRAKNIALLQMIHQNVSFFLCGLFDLNLNQLLGGFGTVTSIVMFFFQL